MRSASALVALCLFGLLHVAVVRARILNVTGQVTWMGPGGTVPLPVNTWSIQPNTNEGSFRVPALEVPSPSTNGVLGCGVFDEQQAVVLTAAQAASFSLSDGTHLSAGVAYDAIYYFCHQTYAIGSGVTYHASGHVTTDNNFVGCTTSDGADNDGANEIASDGLFGLPGIDYQNITQGARGFEGGDTGVPFGTTAVFTNSWTEPGDYVRCFSYTCGNCQCTTTAVLKNSAYCLDSSKPTATIQISDLATTFTDTCSYVSPSSFYAQFIGRGASADGQSITVETSSGVAITVELTAGCGCDNKVTILVPSCAPAGPCDSCATSSTVSADCTHTEVDSSSNCATLAFSTTATNC